MKNKKSGLRTDRFFSRFLHIHSSRQGVQGQQML